MESCAYRYDHLVLGMEMKQPCVSQLYIYKPDHEFCPFWVVTEQLCIVWETQPLNEHG